MQNLDLVPKTQNLFQKNPGKMKKKKTLSSQDVNGQLLKRPAGQI